MATRKTISKKTIMYLGATSAAAPRTTEPSSKKIKRIPRTFGLLDKVIHLARATAM